MIPCGYAENIPPEVDDIQCFALMVYICGVNDDIPPIADGGRI